MCCCNATGGSHSVDLLFFGFLATYIDKNKSFYNVHASKVFPNISLGYIYILLIIPTILFSSWNSKHSLFRLFWNFVQDGSQKVVFRTMVQVSIFSIYADYTYNIYHSRKESFVFLLFPPLNPNSTGLLLLSPKSQSVNTWLKPNFIVKSKPKK